MYKIIGTCRRKVKQEEFDMIEKHFSTLYEAHLEHGKIPEELFDKLGFAEDLDSSGLVILGQCAYQRSR